MLQLKRLTLENFGPFKGIQSLEFPETGIAIVYGENMRGKTSLLNAIRYVLFGKVLSRGSREQPLHLMSNWEEAKRGVFGFRVELAFSNRGHNYVMTRSYLPKKGISEPHNDTDYTEDIFLEKDGVIMGPDQRNLELAHTMPEQVSRFFLFDGELLQEYEELLRDESATGDKIKQSIERILGVPILTNARVDIRELHKKAQKQESLAAQRDLRTREFGNHLADLIEQRTHHEEELARLQTELKHTQEQKLRLEADLERNQRAKILLDNLDELADRVNELDLEIEEKLRRLQEYMVDAWRGLLKGPVQAVRQQLTHERDKLQTLATERALVERLKEALSKEECPICMQPLDTHSKTKINEHIEKISLNEQVDFTQKLDAFGYSIQVLDSFKVVDRNDVVRELNRDLEHHRVEKATTEDRITETEEQVKDFDQNKVRNLFVDHAKIVKQITLLEEGVSDQEDRLNEINNDIRELEKKLAEMGNSGSTVERKKSQLFFNLSEFFDSAVGVYREQLRKKVERDATRIFLKLTTEPEYSGLQITNTYGLVIRHEDGSTVPVRSAGAEHIVALSLMAALQNNAPLKGPIIMDTPFSRLDEGHTSRVVEALPTMADQVVLLVYSSELTPQIAREKLRGNLKSEYSMKRESARHTILEKVVEAI